jgi:hypothetical protein
VTVNGDFSNFPGLGVQVNNWYWTAVSLPVQKGDPQNPDNSGAQFAISDQCVLSHQPAWYGKGIPTYVIATVTAEKTPGECTVTIRRNSYTDAVTPGCCAPPGIGGHRCTGPWGVTNGHIGEPWPPLDEQLRTANPNALLRSWIPLALLWFFRYFRARRG